MRGAKVPAGAAYEIIQPHAGTQTLAHWSATLNGESHAAPGEAAITLARVGKGAAIYLATYFSEENRSALAEVLLDLAEVPPLAQADALVEVTCRHAADRRLFFVLNHGTEAAEITGLPAGIDVISGRLCEGGLALPAYGVAIVEERLDT